MTKSPVHVGVLNFELVRLINLTSFKHSFYKFFYLFPGFSPPQRINYYPQLHRLCPQRPQNGRSPVNQQAFHQSLMRSKELISSNDFNPMPPDKISQFQIVINAESYLVSGFHFIISIFLRQNASQCKLY
eukprot:TRINITY_DN11314_c0_g1_i1.p1 TRINITY_DN11314_c0_g1~~TRINITY_DN11314_c0_g1_i1.p1  ORF type:complete len:130 (-),score=0.68 TRINITY_DN11314_c0_g1_i1:200-589(-)